MLITDLPDFCLLEIFAYCDIRTLATISQVSMRFKEFVLVHFLRKISNFSLTSNTNGIIDDLKTVSRVVTNTNPRYFTVMIKRNLLVSKESSLISVVINSSYTEVLVESHYLQFVNGLNTISKRIGSIHIYCSIYDAHNNDGIDMDRFISWSNLKKLTITGHDKRINHLIQFPMNDWNLEVITFNNMYITGEFINDTLQVGKHLKNIRFEKCKLEKLLSTDVIGMAENVRNGGGHFPLGLSFVNVKVKGYAFLEAFDNNDVRQYIYIQQESIFNQ